jgi:exopolysaccharide biosynthesis protein
MLAQHADGSGGVNLAELSKLLQEQGVVRAIALDGGSSSSLRYKDEVIWGKVSSKGQAIHRPVKSVWLVLPHK